MITRLNHNELMWQWKSWYELTRTHLLRGGVWHLPFFPSDSSLCIEGKTTEIKEVIFMLMQSTQPAEHLFFINCVYSFGDNRVFLFDLIWITEEVFVLADWIGIQRATTGFFSPTAFSGLGTSLSVHQSYVQHMFSAYRNPKQSCSWQNSTAKFTLSGKQTLHTHTQSKTNHTQMYKREKTGDHYPGNMFSLEQPECGKMYCESHNNIMIQNTMKYNWIRLPSSHYPPAEIWEF